MNDRKAKAAKYRDRAEEVRNIAEMMKGEVAKKALRQVASDYEKLARHHERISEAEKSVSHASKLLAAGDAGTAR